MIAQSHAGLLKSGISANRSISPSFSKQTRTGRYRPALRTGEFRRMCRRPGPTYDQSSILSGQTTWHGYGPRLIRCMIGNSRHLCPPSMWSCKTSSTTLELGGEIRRRRCAALSGGTRGNHCSLRSASPEQPPRRPHGSGALNGQSMHALRSMLSSTTRADRHSIPPQHKRAAGRWRPILSRWPRGKIL